MLTALRRGAGAGGRNHLDGRLADRAGAQPDRASPVSHICTGTGAHPATSAPGLRLGAATSAPRLGSKKEAPRALTHTRTKHARMLGYDLQHVQVLPLVCLVVCTVTEFSSNVAIANIVLPILKEQVAANAQWWFVSRGTAAEPARQAPLLTRS